jgi:hypothetical protein
MKHLLVVSICLILALSSCKKNDSPGSHCSMPAENNADLQYAQTLKSGANVPAAWYALVIKMCGTIANQNVGPIISRTFGYMGVTLYESVVHGLQKYQSIQKQLNGLPTLPTTNCGEEYFYPACANAALASTVHHMFGNASAVQNATIDSLKNVFATMFKSAIPQNVYDRSVNFGESISNAVYNWSVSDGGDKAYLTT